jgi:hypothetical protein
MESGNNKATVRQRIADWHQQTLDASEKALEGLFGDLAANLTRHAGKATSDQTQISFYHAQRAIEREKTDLLMRFRSALSARMHDRPRSSDDKSDKPHLTLVNLDAFERSLATKRIVEAGEQDNYAVLFALGHRLSVLQPGVPIDFEDIPGSPAQLVSAFDAVVDQLSIEQSALLALYKAFGENVVKPAAKQYEALNTLLREHGILPNLSLQVKRNPDGTPLPLNEQQPGGVIDEEPATAPKPAPVRASNALLDELRAMLPQRPQRADANYLSAPQVSDIIARQQPQLTELLPEHGLFGGEPHTIIILDEHLQQTQQALEQQRQEIKRLIGFDRLSNYDESTIDIIGGLFEVMLNDSALTDHFKALLSHLHTPYLRLSLREAELLTDEQHPARRLLDEMVRAGEDWGQAEQLGEGIFPTLQEIVSTLRAATAPDSALIAEQRDMLARRVDTLEKRQHLRSHRTTESEMGRAKLEQAQEVAQETVAAMLAKPLRCEPCERFIAGPWRDYLTLVLLRNDCSTTGKPWQLARGVGNVVTDMALSLSSSNPPTDKQINQLRSILANQVGKLIPHFQADIDKLLDALAELRGKQPAPVAAAPSPEVEAARAGGRKAKAHKQDELELNAEEAALVEQLKQTAPGTQFRIPQANRKGTRLVTMTWLNPFTNHMLLVDQNGAKAALLSLQELAKCLHAGTAQLEPETKTPFISRALKALKGYLGKTGVLKQSGETWAT